MTPLIGARADAEWRRTAPDYAVYLPHGAGSQDGYNDHVLVHCTAGGALVAVWTQGSREAASDLRVVCARSEDGGESWSLPQMIAGDDGRSGPMACFGFPVASRSGRLYCFYNQPVDGGEHYFAGRLQCVYSDDEGRTWQAGQRDVPFRRTRFDHPDRRVPCACVVWQKPVRDAQGRWIVGMSRWSSRRVFPHPQAGYHLDSSSELIRFDNLDEGPDPRELCVTWLPGEKGAIRVACPIEPERSRGYSLCEEPSLALLPDGRLFMIMRTVTGRIWYTVSDDDGDSWRRPDVLRDRDGGAEMLHPKAPCPLFALEGGRFLLLFHHHDGFGYGATGPWDMDARRPLCVAVGAYRPGAHQPVWFSHAKRLCDTDGVGAGPESLVWLAMYASLTEREGRRVVWYPDRKHFVLGRELPDEWLVDLTVPR